MAAPDYAESVLETTDQAEKAIAAKEAFVTGMNDAIARGAREAGLRRVGNKKWQDRASTLGKDRYPSGTAAGAAVLGNNFAPFRAELEKLDLDPRGPKGSPENYGRSQKVGEKLHAKKIEQQTST